MIHTLASYTGVFVRLLTIVVMVFFVIPKQIEAFSFKDDFRVLKIMLLTVSGMIIGSTIAYLYLWIGRFEILDIHPNLYDMIVIFTASTSLVIAITFALVYHHKYLGGGQK